MHVIAHKSTDWLQLLSVLVAVQVTAGPMQPQAESSFTGKSRPDMHSCTSHLGCQQRPQSTMSLLMALEVDVHKRDQELKAACCIRHGHMHACCLASTAVKVDLITAPGLHLIYFTCVGPSVAHLTSKLLQAASTSKTMCASSCIPHGHRCGNALLGQSAALQEQICLSIDVCAHVR